MRANQGRRKFHTSKRRPNILPPRKLAEISAPPQAQWYYDWIAASDTRQYLLKDPLNDWIAAHCMSNKNGKTAPTVFRKDSYKDFEEFIMKKGCEFETRIVNEIKTRVGHDNVLELDLREDVRTPRAVQQTLNAMIDGVPVIHGGVLHHVPSKSYGITDLLVRNDWIKRFIDCPPKLPKLVPYRLRTKKNIIPNYYYVVIDIKYSTLPFCANGETLRNSGSFPAYKGQLYIYEQALSYIQGCSPSKAFILGRGWNTDCKPKQSNPNPLNKLGVVDYGDWDFSYVDLTHKAIKWLRDCRAPEAQSWNVTKPPLTRIELYPNMNNGHDYPYHYAKTQLSNFYHDLTELWNVSLKHRARAHEKGVYSWDDPKCTTSVLGIHTQKLSSVLNAMLDINQSHTATFQEGIVVKPKIIKSQKFKWYESQPNEFYVDFETINHVMFPFDHPYYRDRVSMIVTIGVGWICPETKTWQMKNFTIDAIDLSEESRICSEFIDFLSDFEVKYKVTPKCYHWSSAEPNHWNTAMNRISILRRYYPEWADLLVLFKDEPIVIRGALNFSLKTIAKALYANGLINTTWPNDATACKDGLSAMVCVLQSSEEAKKCRIPLSQTKNMKDIINYNEIDVKVLMEILEYLRNHHSPMNQVPDPEGGVFDFIHSISFIKSHDFIKPLMRTKPIATRTRSKTFMNLPIAYRTRSVYQLKPFKLIRALV